MDDRLRVSTRGISLAALAIACLALFVALGGVSYAKRLLGAGDIKKGAIGSKQVRDNSLTGRDIREATLNLAGQKGDKGDRGERGDRGEKGDRGDIGETGGRGPSNAYNSRGASVSDIDVSPTYTVVDTLAVPTAGNHVLNAKLRANYSALAIRCELGTLAGDAFTAHDEVLNIPDGSNADSAVSLAMQAVVSTSGDAPTFAVRCRKSTGPGTGAVPLFFISMTAVEVGAVQTGL